ncbi:MAG: hypothetical protein IMW89_19665 [Ktedonobacteraceae bacterium]|nr:hypothetical protein [Ktedonobacteraceae bacterium]
MSENSENQAARKQPISVVRFGMGKEIRLYEDEIVVTGQETEREIHVDLSSVKRLTLMPGDPTPSKLILMADLDDDTTTILAEGMTNARDFRAMLPRLLELRPDLELDPPDMSDQLWQALNNRRAWAITCYGSIFFICIALYLLYLLVAYLGSRH